MPSIFDPPDADAFVERISRLTPESTPEWGVMSVSQMLAHCSVPFDQVYEPNYTDRHPRPNAFARMLIRLVAKKTVVGDKPYTRSMRTAPQFVITGEPDFATEQAKLIGYVERVQTDGAAAFEGREAHSFGPLTAHEWSTLFTKHTDHHLTQFGV